MRACACGSKRQRARAARVVCSVRVRACGGRVEMPTGGCCRCGSHTPPSSFHPEREAVRARCAVQWVSKRGEE